MGTYIEIDGHSVDALKYIEELEAESKRLGDFANAKVQEIKELRDLLNASTVVDIDGQHILAEPYILTLRGENASLVGVLRDLRTENRELRAKVREYERDDRHTIELREDGYTIQHPMACRPNLFDCVFNRMAEEDFTEPPRELGRFFLDFDGADLTVGERL